MRRQQQGGRDRHSSFWRPLGQPPLPRRQLRRRLVQGQVKRQRQRMQQLLQVHGV